MWRNTHTSVWKIEDSQKQKNQKDSVDFWCRKNDFESTNIVNFEEVVHNFGRSDNEKGLFSIYEKAVVWCPTWLKNLGPYLIKPLLHAKVYLFSYSQYFRTKFLFLFCLFYRLHLLFKRGKGATGPWLVHCFMSSKSPNEPNPQHLGHF